MDTLGVKNDILTLKKLIELAIYAKGNGWSYEGIDPNYRVTSPGDIYEYYLNQMPELIEKIEGKIRELEGRK